VGADGAFVYPGAFMAANATVYTLAVELADVDRGVYESLELRLARHPSETLGFMVARALAYCLEYEEGIAFAAGGVSDLDEPAIVVRDLTGRLTAWIEVGAPDPARLHRGVKRAGRAAVYTHRDAGPLLAQLGGATIHRAADIPVYAFDPRFIESLAGAVGRRTALSLSRTERELYAEIDGRTHATTLAVHRLGGAS
jgi:uncharacterized protein YaeQ